jgi:hypothetical protein
MDPYLEQHWGDVHHRLITYASDQLQPTLPKDLRARVEERVYVESVQGASRTLVPDVRIVERGRGKGKPASKTRGLAVAEPLLIHLDEPTTQGYIEIRDIGSDKKVVTVIEVLSPANKAPGDGQVKYLQKQRELQAAQVNLVQIDLLRTGQPLLPIPRERISPAYRTTYQVVVRLGWEPTLLRLHRLPLRERLPVILIPLRPKDKYVPLDLQALVDECYRNGGYEDDLDYTVDPDPPLDPADARWADALLRRKGLRPRQPARRPRRQNGKRGS